MARFLKIYLVATGILAVLSPIAALALFVVAALIPPFGLLGIILGWTPTAFLWGLLFAAVWFSIRSRIGSPWAFVAGSAAVSVWAVFSPLLVNGYLAHRVAQARAGDGLPATPVVMNGVLRIERSRDAVLSTRRGNGPERFVCDDLCAAALFTPGIEAIVVALTDEPQSRALWKGDDRTAAYRLRRGDCPEPLLPQGSGLDLGDWPDAPALHTSHELALSRGTCLVLDDAIPDSDWTLRLARETLHGPDWRLTLDDGKLMHGVGSFDPLGTITQTRMSLDLKGTRVLQQTRIDTQPLATPLVSAANGGLLAGFRFGWLRRERTEGRFDPIEVLARTTDLRLSPATSPTPDPTGEAIREALAVALSDPLLPAGAAGFSLLGPLFEAMHPREQRPDVRPGDAALIARAVADPRVRDTFHIGWAIQALRTEAETLRAPMVARVLAARVPEDRAPARDLGQALADFPPGTFATPTPEEERLLTDPVRRRWATGLIERQADRGAAAGPALVSIIAQAYGRPRTKADGDISWDMHGDAKAALRALCLIGPAAANQFTSLTGLIESGAVPRYVLDEHAWQFTLARLSGATEGVTTTGTVSASRNPPTRGPWPVLTRFKPEYCR